MAFATDQPALAVDGFSIPTFIYGTAWKEEQTQACVDQAIQAGFRGIDTANQRKHYFEEGVGNALSRLFASGKVRRDEVFLQTKFTHQAGQDERLPYDPHASYALQVAQSFALSLQHLQTSYIDSYVLHGPLSRQGLAKADWEVWQAMEALYHTKQIRFLGISNVNLEQIKELHTKAAVKPLFVQNRCYAATGWDHGVRTYCRDHNIIYQGFSLLTANMRELSQPSIQALAITKRAPLAAIVFRFAQQMGMLPLTGTTKADHMRDDLKCYELELSSKELQLIEEIGR